ncbi:MAG: hypothetical protein VW443_06380, partial [Pseudomonadales bacterium]
MFRSLRLRRRSRAVSNPLRKTERRVDIIHMPRQAAQKISFLLLLVFSLTAKATEVPDSVDANALRDRSEIHSAFSRWFERFRAQASPLELHDFLWSMPKGADLHLHITGSIF